LAHNFGIKQSRAGLNTNTSKRAQVDGDLTIKEAKNSLMVFMKIKEPYRDCLSKIDKKGNIINPRILIQQIVWCISDSNSLPISMYVLKFSYSS
jgi:hypothetical protein